MSWRRPAAVASLDMHPNLAEIVRVLNRIERLTDHEVARLASGWRDTSHLAHARNRALTPDSPLVIDVLAAFDQIDAALFTSVGASFGADLDADDDSSTAVAAHRAIASKAIRDALAAAYARPILSRAEYLALIGPWRRTFPSDDAVVDPGIAAR